jgi:DNA-binding IclR family transcriptional regulator
MLREKKGVDDEAHCCYISTMPKLPAQPIQGLIDGITVLQELTTQREPCSVSALGRELGLEKTRVHRILGTFAHLGIVHRTAEGRYAAGPGMHVLAAQSLYSSGLMQRSLARLGRLGATAGCVTALGVLWRDKVSYLYHQTPGVSPLESVGRMGLFEASRSSIGIMLLALHQEPDVRQLYADRPIQGFESMDTFLQELALTRTRGFTAVISKGKHRSIAIPVGTPPYAAIALAGSMTDEDQEKALALLRGAAHDIEGGPDEPS